VRVSYDAVRAVGDLMLDEPREGVVVDRPIAERRHQRRIGPAQKRLVHDRPDARPSYATLDAS